MANWKGQDWVPIWVSKWLLGSTRSELSEAERSIWIDFLCLAGLEGGHITKRSYEELARQLSTTVVLIDKCVIRFIATGKIEAYSDRWVIKHWEEYQLPQWKPPKLHKKKNYSDNCQNKESQLDLIPTGLEVEVEVEENISNTEKSIASGQISEFIATYNSLATNLQKVERMTLRRREKIQTRLNGQPSLEWWKDVFRMANEIDLAPNEKYPDGWRPSFDWLIDNESNSIKVHEGKYQRRQKLDPGEKWLMMSEEHERKQDAKRRQAPVYDRGQKAQGDVTLVDKTERERGNS